MTLWSHKCEWCDRIYACECPKEHRNQAPKYDCGKCVHRSETIKGVQTMTAIMDGKTRDYVGPSANGKRIGWRQ